MQMSKKYVVSIMERHYLGDGFFLFNCNHTEVGEMDEQTHIFTDRNGIEYESMLNPDLLSSEIPYAYSNTIELKKLPKSVGPNLSIKEAVSEFDYLCKQVVYLVCKTEDEKVLCVRLNMDTLRDNAEQSYLRGQETEEDEEDMDPALKELVTNVINGKYSLSQLKAIVEDLKTSEEDLQQVIDTIELQIEATEKGESLIDLPEDDLDEECEEEEEENTVDIDDDQRRKNKQNRIDIDDLFKKVTKTLIAQDEPARRVITEIARKEMDERKKKQGILLTGATGVGKTELMRLIAKYLDKPFIKVDSTQLTIPGYVGKDIEEVLWDLYIKCGEDVDKAEQAIIFFDEIDKKGSTKKSDVSGQGVLNVLLPFIEGSTYDACPDMRLSQQKVPIRTNNMTVILGGAYTDVYKNLAERPTVGFGTSDSTKPKYRKATTKDFIERGMMTDEFMGRVTVIKLNDLDVKDIKRIMLESDESMMKVQAKIFQELGVKLTFTDDYTNRVAQNAYDKKAGARGLNSIIDDSTWKAFDEVYCHPGEYEEVIVDEKTVDNPESFQLVKKKESH